MGGITSLRIRETKYPLIPLGIEREE